MASSLFPLPAADLDELRLGFLGHLLYSRPNAEDARPGEDALDPTTQVFLTEGGPEAVKGRVERIAEEAQNRLDAPAHPGELLDQRAEHRIHVAGDRDRVQGQRVVGFHRPGGGVDLGDESPGVA